VGAKRKTVNTGGGVRGGIGEKRGKWSPNLKFRNGEGRVVKDGEFERVSETERHEEGAPLILKRCA